MHDQTVGSPMNVSGQRKQKNRETSNSELSSELFALTSGVSRKCMKTIIVAKVRLAPNRDKVVRIIPIVSVYDRNSVAFMTHLSRLSFDQYSSGHRMQSAAPVKCKKTRHCDVVIDEGYLGSAGQFKSLPVVFDMEPSAHGMQSKQHTGRPLICAFRVPFGQVSEQTDFGI